MGRWVDRSYSWDYFKARCWLAYRQTIGAEQVMQDLRRNDNIAYRAIGRSRPGPWSWLGLPLFIGSLLLAVEFRGALVGQMQYRELFGDAALATLDNVILGFSLALAVAGSLIAWRVWWTFSLIGTTALGMPDLAAIGAGRLRAGVARSVITGLGLIESWASALGGAAFALARFLRLMVMWGVSVLTHGMALADSGLQAVKVASLSFWCKALALAATPIRAAAAILFHYLEVVLALMGSTFGAALAATAGSMQRILTYGGKRLWLGVAISSRGLWMALAFMANRLWSPVATSFRWLGVAATFGISILRSALVSPVRLLWSASTFVIGQFWHLIIGLFRRSLGTGRLVGRGTSRLATATFARFPWKALVFSGRRLRSVVSTTLVYLGRNSALAGRHLWGAIAVLFRHLGRSLAFGSKYVWLAMSTPVIYLGKAAAWSMKSLWSGATWLWFGLGRGSAAASRPVGSAIAALFRHLGRSLAFAVKYVWLAMSTPLVYLGKGTALSLKSLWSAASWLWLALGRGSAAASRPAGSAIAVLFRHLGRSLAFASKYLWLAISTPVIYLGKGTAWSLKSLWRVASWLWFGLGRGSAAAGRPAGSAIAVLFRLLGRSLAFAGKYLWLAMSTPVIYLGKGSAWYMRSLWSGASWLWTVLARGSAAAGRPIWGAVTIAFQNQGRSLRDSARYCRSAMSAIGHDLQAALDLSGRFSKLTLAASLRYARSGLTFGVSNLAVAAGVLAFSPLVPLRLVVDKTFRQETAARASALWAALKAHPAVGVLCIGVVVGLGFGLFWLGRPGPTVEVLIWTSGEKQEVMLPALNRLNAGSHTVTVDGRRYRVRARSVTVDSAEMHAYLVARLTQGTDFPEGTGGAPTVVSPSTSSWLAQVNLDTGQQVFQMDHIRPIVRTPVVIFTYRGMAECLGWPERLVGWADIIALAESPEGWAACPTARPDWGEKPLVLFADPAVSSTARSTLQILHVVAAGKPAEQLTVEDIEDPKVRDFVRRFKATVDHFDSDKPDVQTAMRQGPGFVHFVPVEEYNIPRFYQGRGNAEPGSEVVAIYPGDGTVWHDNPFAVPDGPWVTAEQREAARVVGEYLRSEDVQRQFMEAGFRAGIYVPLRDTLTPPRGLDLKQPQVYLGRVSAEAARAIQQSWEQ